MNEQDRAELQLLKARQSAMQAQCADLARRIDAFETRVARIPEPAAPPVASPTPVFAEPTPQPAVPPPIAPRVQPVIPPAQQPAIIIPKIAPVPPIIPVEPIPAAAQTSTARPSEPIRPAPPTKRPSFEMRLGTFWLVRIGIVMLLTSLVFFGTYAYQNFIPRIGPGGKVALLYLASGVLLGLGGWLQRKQESLKNYGQVLQAGGLAAVYFTTYAAHHFSNLQIIPSALADGALLFGWAGFITWLADRKKSEVLALFAVLLGYYTSIITHAGLFTLYSNLVLTLAVVFFLVRNRWATVSFASLAATYVSYAFWRFFHAGEWHWALPTEDLWTGNYFLLGYWLMFTAAVFLSRHESFHGRRRAMFASFNNGAFLSAFLLTMLQVHQGGFWKFSLTYGTALLVLAVLARKWLPSDKLACNTYLTQGVLLVTLGFLTHLAGFKLTLVLGVESVMLLILGTQFQSRVLRAGSLVTAALATGWAAFTIAPFDHTGFIIGLAVGAMMLWNAFWLRRETTYDQSISHMCTVFYTTLGLVVWLVATWQNTAPEWRGLATACESIVFLLAARPLGNQFLKLGSYLFAAISFVWETNHLVAQFNTALVHRVGLLPAVLAAVALLFNAIWEQRRATIKTPQPFDPSTGFYSALGLLGGLLTTAVFTPHQYLAPLLGLEALALTAAAYPSRLKETAVFAHLYLFIAQFLWLHDATVAHVTHPWWNAVIVIAATLLFAAWSPRQEILSLDGVMNLLLQTLHALGVVALLFFWLEPQFSAPMWLAFASGLAILLTAYAASSRFWLLAATSQIFLLISACEFCRQLWTDKPEWYLPLVPVATLVFLSLCAVKWFEQRPGAKSQLRQPILGLAQIYRIIALVMSLWWVHRYIPERENFWFLALLGGALFLAGGWRRNRELLIFSAVFTLVGFAGFWSPFGDAAPVYWPNSLAILTLAAQQQIAQRHREQYQLPKQIHAAAIVLASVSLWFFISRCILQQTGGFYLTAGWSVLALVLFIAGMALSERVYRWLGLAVLACALGRVVIFDVWKLETLYRIFSFMALGIVLLVLGFIYNKYQEKINQWL